PGAGAALIAGGGLPTVERVSETFAGAGFRVEGLAAVDQVSATSLAAYRDKVRRRADTGLKLLPDDQFAAGLAALERAADAETDPPRWSTASTCWSCGARPRRAGGPSGPGRG
ncbi:MAG TPA: hypothetical protein VLR51_03340, partial [Actinomycetes bacterium]|nr:hypothetical protein [Actinomycetes bacterium]